MKTTFYSTQFLKSYILGLLFLVSTFTFSQVYNEKNGMVIMEIENTSSSLDLWQNKATINGSTGNGYLEFTGNNTSSGPAKSPIQFKFKINKSGLYYLHLHCAREKIGDRNDVANDAYVRVEGDYGAGPNAGNSHGNDAPLSMLKSNTKFFGGNDKQFVWASGNRLDPGGHNNKRVAVYNFKAGKEYTLIVSGRSQKFKVNRLLFRHKDVGNNTAQNLSLPESEIIDGNGGGNTNADDVLNTPSKGIYGELKKWHRVTVAFEGPNTSEGASDNPFLNYRLNVTFTHTATGKKYVVPGYYAADGKAANSSATGGKIWRAHFSPSSTGPWTYSAQFRKGNNVAINTSNNAGNAATIDGDTDGVVTGSFSIANSDKSGRDNRAKGRLEYVGERYLRWAETGDYFIKQGPDAPENFLAYTDFDGDFKSDGQKDNLVKNWQPHVQDWKNGNPTWKNGKGKGIIGAVNYLASEGLNVFSFLTMNIGGDDRNVFPYTKYGERVRLDVSRLDQWEVVFNHADTQGMYLHFKTQETENDQLLDNGNLGNQRKLYYRELIARFGHHLALNWNLGEENTQTDNQRKDMTQYFYDVDPYRHNVVIHTYPGQKNQVYTPLLGNKSKLTGLSMQGSNATFNEVHGDVLTWIKKSKDAGKPWVVAYDEPGNASDGLIPDSDNNDSGNGNHKSARQNALWGTMMAGGTGVEWYFGYQHDHSDLSLQDYRSRNKFWDYTRYALRFFEDNDIPFAEMTNRNDLIGNGNNNIGNGYCFAKAGDTYVVYLPKGGSKNLNLNGQSGSYAVKWYNPRNGGSLQNGSVTNINGGGSRSLGNPPNSTNQDWVVFVAKGNGGGGNNAPTVNFVSPSNGDDFNEGDNIEVQANASDSDGTVTNVSLSINNQLVGKDTNAPYSWSGNALLQNLQEGLYTLKIVAEDNDGDTSNKSITIKVGNVTSNAKEIPGIIQAEDFDNQSGIQVENTTDTGGGENVGFINNGDSATYNVNVKTTGSYDVAVRVASATSGGKLILKSDNQVVGSVDVTGTTGWQKWVTVTTKVDLVAGDRTLKLEFTGGSGYLFNYNYLDFKLDATQEPETITLSTTQDAYMQGSTRYNSTIVRIENGKRTGFLQFDLSKVSGTITEAKLQFVVDSDPGNGNLNVNKGNSNNWTENNISNSNKPAIGTLLGNVNRAFGVGNTVTIDLKADQISGNKLSLVLTQTSGNDFAFASKEHGSKATPKLILTFIPDGRETDFDKDSLSIIAYPNPVVNFVTLKGQIKDKQFLVIDIKGAIKDQFIAQDNEIQYDMSSYATGNYFVRIVGSKNSIVKKIIKN